MGNYLYTYLNVISYCEIVGSDITIIVKQGNYDNHIEKMCGNIIHPIDNNLQGKVFTIEITQRGCINKYVCFEIYI